MIPLLAEQYLYGKNDYYFRIVDRYDGSVVYQSAEGIDGSSFQKADLQYPLLRSDFRVAFGRQRDPLDSRDSPAAALNILRTRRDVFIAHSDTDRRINIVLSPTAAMLREAAESARWVLEAVHRSGSLAAAVRSGMIRNSILSSGILLLLGAALMVMAMSVRRNQELAERQGEFIATVTHELKSPVAVIRSAADNLASGIIRDAEKTMRYGAAIREEGNRLTLMIDRLLAYARVGDSVPELTESVDLRSLAEKVLGTYQKELEEAAFRVETSLKADMVVKGDRTALELALGNLIGNAVKHGKSGEFLGVDLREDDGWAVVAVRDHGPGVPRKERRLIFEAFYRGESARKEQRPGSGLGLNLVKRIVSAHGGMVRYAALGDLGSVFSLRLPTAARHG
jgi:two-component system phosphate regulon sensor histidine kinase PhoR